MPAPSEKRTVMGPLQMRCAGQRHSGGGWCEGARKQDALRVSGAIARVQSSIAIIEGPEYIAAKVGELFVDRGSHKRSVRGVVTEDNYLIETVT